MCVSVRVEINQQLILLFQRDCTETKHFHTKCYNTECIINRKLCYLYYCETTYCKLIICQWVSEKFIIFKIFITLDLVLVDFSKINNWFHMASFWFILQRSLKKFWRLYHTWPSFLLQYLWICGAFGLWWWKLWQIGLLISFQVRLPFIALTFYMLLIILTVLANHVCSDTEVCITKMVLLH